MGPTDMHFLSQNKALFAGSAKFAIAVHLMVLDWLSEFKGKNMLP